MTDTNNAAGDPAADPNAAKPGADPNPNPNPNPAQSGTEPNPSSAKSEPADLSQAFAALPDDQKEFARANGLENKPLGDILAVLAANQKFTGADKATLMRKPKETAEENPEAWAEYHKARGVPDSPDGYDAYEREEGENLIPEAQRGELDKLFHERNFTPEDRNAALDLYHEMAAKTAEAGDAAYEQEVQAGLEGLKKEWGAKYSENLDAAKAVVEQVGGKELGQFLDETGLGDDPRLIKFMANVAAKLGEDGAPITGKSAGGRGSRTPEEAQRALKAFEAKHFDALRNPNNPERQDLLKERNTLYAEAHPGQSA